MDFESTLSPAPQSAATVSYEERPWRQTATSITFCSEQRMMPTLRWVSGCVADMNGPNPARTGAPNHSVAPWKGTRIFDRRGFRRRGNAHLPAVSEVIE